MKKMLAAAVAAVMTMSASMAMADGASKIGEIGPLTGAAAIYGTAVANGRADRHRRAERAGGQQYELNAQDDEADAEELETALNTCFNAAKTGKEIAFGKLMEQLKGENYENVLFTLKRLDHLLDSALPGDSAARPTLEKLLAAAQTPEDVSARFEPRLEKLLSQQKAQKHNRTQKS